MRGWTAVGTVLGVLLGAGCGPAPYTIGPEEPGPAPAPPEVYVFTGGARAAAPVAEPPSEPVDRWIPDGFPRLNPFAERRTWVGAYDCPQGRTDLALRIVDVHGRRVRAIFDFHHAPTDVAGQHLLAGTFDEQTGDVVFAPGAWIIHPDRYVTVGMVGRVSHDGTRFAGRIVSPGCGEFRLRAAR
jgi:hypothetical protein